ncbi:hypothetical protein [Pseudooceanicola sp. MF1-13]|uniref:hypothetical protein n=1 Tax=Pseudooceanicola sp. MF1-13 TaxID=3379095 RepID=UPI003891CE30
MPVRYANPRERAFEIINAKNKVRLRDPSTGEYLHLSGTGMTKSVDRSWLGHLHQADTLKQRAEARREDWTLQPVPRDDPHAYEPDVTQ